MIRVDVRGRRFGDAEVLGPIRFEVKPGERLAVTGPSGVGKTTLLRVIAGLDADFEGAVDAPARRAMAFQEPVLMPWRSAADNITLATGAPRAATSAALAEVGLAGREDAFPGQLSLGQQRRLSLARAFAASPEMLLMDEPFVSLDPDLVEEMLTLTERMLAARDIAVILVTHSMAEAERLATRIMRLEGRPATLRDL